MRATALAGLVLALGAVAPVMATDMIYGYPPGLAPVSPGPLGFRPGSVFYAEPPVAAAPETLTLRGSVGVMYLRGDEYVFNGNSILSQLIWESRVPVMRGAADLNLGGGFSVSAGGSVAGLGSSYMEDYDWLVATNSFDDWTHRSQHDDTVLDHYFSVELAGGYDVARTDTAFVRAQAGLRYTDTKWSARGGNYLYSVNGFRDTAGTIPAGTLAGDYRQQLPEVFVGVDGEERYGAFTLGAMLRGGLSVLGRSTDNHWLRDLRIEDSFRVAPTFSAGLDVGYALGPMADLFISTRYDQALQMRGEAKYYDTRTGDVTISGDDLAGAQLRSISLTAGLKGRF